MKLFKKTIPYILAVCACAALPAVIGCTVPGDLVEYDAVTGIANGGFETGDLSGWTIERGDAFDDDSVSSVNEFFYSYDSDHTMIPVGKTGNWYLSGKGYDGMRPHGYTGSVRSDVFTLGGDGTVSMKLAGGALVTQRGENAPLKSPEKTCYVGVYRASDDLMIAKFTNKYFLEHTESYVNVSDYENGTCCTDNFYNYTEDLSDYYGQQLYIRIVDNDTHHYYGYISVDDIRIGGGSAQTDGTLFAKTRDFTATAEKPSIFEIANGGFETGSLAGWTIVSGDAFSNDGVNNAKYWWNENIPYKRDGDYHYGHYKPSAVGVMRSSDFVVGGSGYVTYKLGGCSNNAATYLRFMVKNGAEDIEAARFSNYKYWNYQFPFVQNGMRLLNLVQYYADFSAYKGQTMYIEVVDENAGSDELGCITLDSVVTYHEQIPVFNNTVAFEAKTDPDLNDIEPDNEFQVKNGTFETGDLTGWTMVGNFGEVSDATGWWNENFPYNKKGKFLFTGINNESGVGTLTSDPFTLGGSGDITFRLGGCGNPAKCYVSIVDADSDYEYVRFANLNFRDNGIETINTNSFLANMVSYRANLIDLGIESGTRLKIRITDNASTRPWGLITADSFITYYERSENVPKNHVIAKNIKSTPLEDTEYQIRNGDFEMGDLTGWTVVGDEIDTYVAVTFGDTFWNQGIPYNNGGLFHFDGWKAIGDESASYALRSETFILDGSGYISFKMGGRTAQVKVYKAGDTPELIAVYNNTAFADVEFPFVDKGCRLGTMTTFAANLSDHIGETLYIELCDKPSETNADGDPLSWGVVFFDDVITYYETAPTVSDKFDTVTLNAQTSATGVTTYNIPWVEAENLLSED